MYASFIYGVFCILVPVIAWIFINQNWEFMLPLIGITFKPWRLFMIVCSTPTLCCFLAMFFLPESPKFVLCQGRKQKAIAILEEINRWNNGKNAKALNIREIYDDTYVKGKCSKDISLMRSVWVQTAPLFTGKYIKTTLLACFIQFGLFANSNGMYMWFPDILNRIGVFEDHHPEERITMCEIVYRTTSIKNATDEVSCVNSLDIAAYQHSFILEIIYALGFAFIGASINKLGKFVLLCQYFQEACIFNILHLIQLLI